MGFNSGFKGLIKQRKNLLKRYALIRT